MCVNMHIKCVDCLYNSINRLNEDYDDEPKTFSYSTKYSTHAVS